jgi:hypothetical protein
LNTQIHFFICPHGFGHIKRSLEITKQLLIQNDFKITFHVNELHYNQFNSLIASWMPDFDIGSVSFETALMDFAPDYKLSNTTYTYKHYQSWIEDISKIKLTGNDIIISDNSIGPLFMNQNCILIGSFLWFSIHLLMQGNWKTILEKEKMLVIERHPKMFGLETMAMPDVKLHTNFIGGPWLCSRFADIELNKEFDKIEILLSAGGTTNSYGLFLEFVKQFPQDDSIKLFVDKGLKAYFCQHGIDLPQFDFSYKAFSNLSMIIARPGIGILTECVNYSIPIMCLYEQEQDEMLHNATIVQQRKFGLDLSRRDIDKVVNQIIGLIKNKQLMLGMRQNLLNESTEGIAYIVNKLMA